MSKRFTDINKWRNEWYRTLPVKAKLTWVYLCDECDFTGVWKCDFGLASFQLDFNITKEDLKKWFANKVCFFGADTMLIVPFFNFQYGDSKDSWTAKTKAKEKLENLGFSFKGNILDLDHGGTTVTPQSSDCLVVGEVKGEGEVNNIINIDKIKNSSNELPELMCIWNEHLKNKEFSKVIKTNKERNKKILELWPQLSKEEWVDVVKKINDSDFCRGTSTNSTGWVATFDWLLKKETYLKILDGAYDNRKPKKEQRGHLRDAETVANDFNSVLEEIRNG